MAPSKRVFRGKSLIIDYLEVGRRRGKKKYKKGIKALSSGAAMKSRKQRPRLKARDSKHSADRLKDDTL